MPRVKANVSLAISIKERYRQRQYKAKEFYGCLSLTSRPRGRLPPLETIYNSYILLRSYTVLTKVNIFKGV